MSGDPVLTRWAAACAEHAIAEFAQGDGDGPAELAISSAQSWARGTGNAEAVRDAALEAQMLARATADAGNHALASAIRAASSAAASIDDVRLARRAADYAAEAVELSSAGCELASRAGAERRWQWDRLDERLRGAVVGDEPPAPPVATCAIETLRT